MSVSLALLPVALALRVVMGKENFEAWVASQQERAETDITSEFELARLLKQAGYDAVKFGALVKTHLDGERAFFFWEFIDGKWVAPAKARTHDVINPANEEPVGRISLGGADDEPLPSISTFTLG